MSVEREPLRLVLLGKTGVGKSAAGNTILNERAFKSEVKASSVTAECRIVTKSMPSIDLTVMDTPGLYDTTLSNEKIAEKIVEGLQLIEPGPHAFLLVIDVRRFTEEERDTVKKFQHMFGDGVHKHMIVLFTRGDDLEYDGKTIEMFIKEAGEALQNLLEACGNRSCLFNNRESTNRTQVDKLLEMINEMMKKNKHSYYNYELFSMATELKNANTRDQEEMLKLLKANILMKLLKMEDSSNCCIL